LGALKEPLQPGDRQFSPDLGPKLLENGVFGIKFRSRRR
jgi:hypothetical protein